MNWPAERAEVKSLSNKRGDSPYRGCIDKSHSSSLHIQPDNWALRRSQCHWVRPVMRKPVARRSLCEQEQLSLWFMQQQTFEIVCQGIKTWARKKTQDYLIPYVNIAVTIGSNEPLLSSYSNYIELNWTKIWHLLMRYTCLQALSKSFRP